MTEITIRDARYEDLPFIVELIAHDGVTGTTEDLDNPTGPGYTAAFEAISADPNQMLLIAEAGGERVGTFQLTFTPGIFRQGGWRCTIEGVHVAARHRNRKIGEKMMLWALDVARARKCAMVQLTSNKARTAAHRFYERLGFARSHEGFKYYP